MGELDKKTGVMVIGAEHSGTRFLWALMELHPHVKAFHYSLPSGGGLYKIKNISAHAMTFGIDRLKYIYVVRDKSCTLKSQKKENSVKPVHLKRMRAKDSIEMADKFFLQEAKKNNIEYIFVSYETMVRFRDQYLWETFIRLELDPSVYNWKHKGVMDIGYGKISVIPNDGNKKYIK